MKKLFRLFHVCFIGWIRSPLVDAPLSILSYAFFHNQNKLLSNIRCKMRKNKKSSEYTIPFERINIIRSMMRQKERFSHLIMRICVLFLFICINYYLSRWVDTLEPKQQHSEKKHDNKNRSDFQACLFSIKTINCNNVVSQVTEEMGKVWIT